MAREKGDARGTAPPAASPPDAGSEPPPPSQTAPPPQTGAGTTGYSAASGPIRRPDERLVRRGAAPPPEPTPPTQQGQVSRAARVVEPANVTGRLVPGDRAALSAALAELIARAGGAEAARRPEGSDLVIEVVVPRAAYADFARGLAGLGQWVVARAAPDLPPAVRVLISIAP
jgi:hypothetical protein